MNNTSVIVSLIRKKLEGQIDAQELLLLEEWAQKSRFNADLLKKIEDEEVIWKDIRYWLELEKDDEDWVEQLENRTFSKIYKNEKLLILKRKFHYQRLLPYVACLLVAASVGFIYFTKQAVENDITLVQDLKPGTNRAIITLADGRTIELSDEQNGIVLNEKLTYQDGSPIAPVEQVKAMSFELKTPKGGQYQVTLPDGSKLWLNADSKLIYPAKFESDRRVVILDGEAYFEITQSTIKGRKIPFIVKTAQQEVEVLGTQFNVMAYKEDDAVQTTLVEGAVKIHSGNKIVQLVPGEQAIVQGELLNKKRVDVSQYVAWKNNEFMFYETDLREAMQALSRWYDFEVVYEGTFPATHFYGNINRSKGLLEVLKILKMSELKFKIERVDNKNRVTILK